MRVIKPTDFQGEKAWDALDIEQIQNATVRLHWADQPYIWHVNVEMHIGDAGLESVLQLSPGEIFHAETGDRHKAVPLVPSRILVIESEGSI